MKVNILIIEGTPDALTVNDPDFSMFRSDLICLLIGTLKMVKVLNVRHDAATQPYDFGVLIRRRLGWCKLLTRNIVLYGRIPYVVEGQTRMSASTFRSGLTSSSGYKRPRHLSASFTSSSFSTTTSSLCLPSVSLSSLSIHPPPFLRAGRSPHAHLHVRPPPLQETSPTSNGLLQPLRQNIATVSLPHPVNPVHSARSQRCLQHL